MEKLIPELLKFLSIHIEVFFLIQSTTMNICEYKIDYWNSEI